MKNATIALLAIAGAGLFGSGLLLGVATAPTHGATIQAARPIEPEAVAAPAPAPRSSPIVDPFKQPAAPASSDIVDPFKQSAVTAAGCPAGFVNQGGLCVDQVSVDYQADARRRAENRELARAVADELRGD